MKAKCKENNCTINEALLSLDGQTMKEYANNRGDAELESIRIAQIVSFAPYAKSIQDIKFGNYWVPIYIDIPVENNIEGNIEYNKENSKVLRGSNKILGTIQMTNMLFLLPYNIAKKFIFIANSKVTCIFSPVAGPKKRWVINGNEVNGVVGFMSDCGNNRNVFCLNSIGDVLTIGLTCD